VFRCRRAAVIPCLAVTVVSCRHQTVRAKPASFEPAACPNPIVPGEPHFDLEAEFECGYLTVPEDRSRPDGRTIRIPIARLPAQSPTPRNHPIVFLAGGPGGSGLLEPSAASGWNTDRDVIFVSQRGTLKANPWCPVRRSTSSPNARPSWSWRIRPRPRLARPRPAHAKIDTPARAGIWRLQHDRECGQRRRSSHCFADTAATSLPNSRQLVFPGAGRAVFSALPECFATVMTNFLDRPDFDSSCVAAEQVSPFVTS
jgi:hypothetical protein